jgi:hypothetical protein
LFCIACVWDLLFVSALGKKRKKKKLKWSGVTMSWESMLPLGVISAMIFVMANSQDVINRFTTGKPKHPRNDAWDRAMDERDARIKEEATRAHQN